MPSSIYSYALLDRVKNVKNNISIKSADKPNHYFSLDLVQVRHKLK